MKHSAGRKELRMKMRANRRAAGSKLHKQHVLEQRHPKKPKAQEVEPEAKAIRDEEERRYEKDA